MQREANKDRKVHNIFIEDSIKNQDFEIGDSATEFELASELESNHQMTSAGGGGHDVGGHDVGGEQIFHDVGGEQIFSPVKKSIRQNSISFPTDSVLSYFNPSLSQSKYSEIVMEEYLAKLIECMRR